MNMSEINPSGCNQTQRDNNNKMFNMYEKSTGRYLGHATVTADLNGEDLLGENVEFAPQPTFALKEEYFEEEEVEKKCENYLEISKEEVEMEMEKEDANYPPPAPAPRRSGRPPVPNKLYPSSDYDLSMRRSRQQREKRI